MLFTFAPRHLLLLLFMFAPLPPHPQLLLQLSRLLVLLLISPPLLLQLLLLSRRPQLLLLFPRRVALILIFPLLSFKPSSVVRRCSSTFLSFSSCCHLLRCSSFHISSSSSRFCSRCSSNFLCFPLAASPLRAVASHLSLSLLGIKTEASWQSAKAKPSHRTSAGPSGEGNTRNANVNGATPPHNCKLRERNQRSPHNETFNGFVMGVTTSLSSSQQRKPTELHLSPAPSALDIVLQPPPPVVPHTVRAVLAFSTIHTCHHCIPQHRFPSVCPRCCST